MGKNLAQEREEIVSRLRKDGYIEAADLIEQLTAEPPNEPLTLEELRGMDGQPVWVLEEGSTEPVPMKVEGVKCVHYWPVEDLEFGYYGPGTDDYYGWLAYRGRPVPEE